MGLVTTDIQAAATALAAGHVCAIPTETVYGLAANALEATAIAAVFALKGRPADPTTSKPSATHVTQPGTTEWHTSRRTGPLARVWASDDAPVRDGGCSSPNAGSKTVDPWVKV